LQANVAVQAYNSAVLNAPRGGHHLRRDLLLASAFTALLLAFAPPVLARYAYVANSASDNVSAIDTATNQLLGSPIAAPAAEYGTIAITPDGSRAYVADGETDSVSVIDTATNQVIGGPITVGDYPVGVAITPDGKRAFVSNESSDNVSVIDTATNQVRSSPITVGDGPFAVAITPDGKRAYVANYYGGSVSVIDTATNQVVGSPIAVGGGPDAFAITPDGTRAYVINTDSSDVSVIDTATNAVVGSPITVGTNPLGIAITPDGSRAYVTNSLDMSVSVIDTATNQVVGGPIMVGIAPWPVAITPDGKRAYVANYHEGDVSVIDTVTNLSTGTTITVGSFPDAVAIVPDQPPVASFSDPFSRPGVPVAFNASASSDPDGSIARYDWAFGDGAQALNGGPKPSHAYGMPGTYKATLTLTDNEGCSTSLIFTGQTAYCNGSASASQTRTVKVAYPGVRLICPKRAKPRVCRFKLQAVSKKRNGKAQSAVAKAKAKPGRSVVVSLKPKKKFRIKLAAAKKILVRESVTIDGSKRTLFTKLKVVQ
jgi:YVTN family beta-propeller protein